MEPCETFVEPFGALWNWEGELSQLWGGVKGKGRESA